MAQLELLKRSRQTVKAALTRLVNYCNDAGVQVEEVRVRAERAEELFKQYEQIQQEIDTLTAEEHLADEDKYRSEIEEKYFSIKTTFNRLNAEISCDRTVIETQQPASDIATAMQVLLEHQSSMGILIERLANNTQISDTSTPALRQLRQQDAQQAAQQPQFQQSELRLPRIQIPDFDGNCLEWLRFRDLFEAMVDSKVSIADVEKLEYLQTKLKGEALSLVKHLKPTNANYTTAWQLLKKRYDQSDKLKNSYLELLLEQEPIRSETKIEVNRFYNNINESYNALKVIDDAVSQWDTILLFNLEKKLDDKSASLWFREKKSADSVTFQQFLEFLEKRVYELDNINKITPNIGKQSKERRSQLRTYAATVQTCPVCAQNHFVYHCDKFKQMSVDMRRNIIQQHKICFNCLQESHMARMCKRSNCKKCGGRHNTLLHLVPLAKQTLAEEPQEAKQIANYQQPRAASVKENRLTEQTRDQASCMSINVADQPERAYTLLPTAMVLVTDNCGMQQRCRVLLDSGSQSTLVSEACMQRLGLMRTYDKTRLFGVGVGNTNHTRGRVQLCISSENKKSVFYVEALCLTKLTQNLPADKIANEKLVFFKDLNLADPTLCTPGQIDLILGADIFIECLLPQKIPHPSGSPTAINTVFGWILIGNINKLSKPEIVSCYVSIDLDKQLQRFWEVEELHSTTHSLTPEEEAAENHYRENTSRNPNGRYVVRLPLKENVHLGESKYNAVKRLYAMERKFNNNEELKQQYIRFMEDYTKLGHMKLSKQISEPRACYLPHHAVFKPTSTTTRLRVVFDASCKTTNGYSLKDKLMVGPTIQHDLFDIVIKFRKYQIAWTSDIEKMYRQVLVHPSDCPLQRIVWRASRTEPILEYDLQTITYGTSAAPFLATRTLEQVAIDNSKLYPSAAEAIRQHFYMDDYMGCASNIQEALQLKQELCKILSEAGFHLRKWSSNSMELLNTVQPEDRATTAETIIDQTATVSTLGLLWDTNRDEFKYSISLPAVSQYQITKREVLSEIARIYDPMGWIAPVVIHMKIFMQKLWLKGIKWDEPLSTNLYQQWRKYRENIIEISSLRIPRWLHYTNDDNVELHGFSDASELAYSATIYLRTHQNNKEVHMNLIAAKTRVSPVKQITLPRLELCAAHLMVKLMTKIRKALGIDKANSFGWTDSTIVLAWISDHPRRWKAFIANRTSQIIEVIPARQWRHISSRNNPADLATRGIWPAELINNNLWWHGPKALHQASVNHEPFPPIADDVDMEERKETIVNVLSISECDIFDRYSDLSRLIRITALLLRFAYNCKSKLNKYIEFLTTSELRNAHDVLVRKSQRTAYETEIRILLAGKQLSTKHKLASLDLFIDDKGLVRVGGRLCNADVPFDQKHPMLLSKQHQLSKLIVQYTHIKHLHAGTRLMHYILGLKYWIPSASYVIKQCVYKCTICMRQRGKPYQQQMGNIPKHRLRPGSTFPYTATDFAGPFQVLSWKGRGSRKYKCWIALFVCLVTKAVHIELVTELTTAAFIATFRHFIARRGRPAHVYSDNGTNFIGTNQYLQGLYGFLRSQLTQEAITRELSEQQIQWHFSPPSGPHFGGIWEAGIKSIKYHLRRILANTSTTYEEMYTVLCQIEGCLNSRPLCLKFEGDTDPLTPAHFLIMRPMTTIPDEALDHLKDNHLNRWQYLQRLVQQFWRKWSMEYLSQLQHRPKWKQRQPNICINDVVLIKDETLSPSYWPIGKIIELHPGADGLIRVATVNTTKGTFKRPIAKLCPLFLDI